jgi:plastocyanin
VQGFAFKPQTIEVKVGAKVTWTNQDGAPHTTTSGTPGAKDGKWEGQLGGSGGSFSFTFAQAGTFAYFCGIHGASMTGTVVVK